MKSVALLLLAVAAAPACTTTEDQVWTLEFKRPFGEDPCTQRDLRVTLTDHGGGDYAGSAVNQAGEMHVAKADNNDAYSINLTQYYREGERMFRAFVTPEDQPGDGPGTLFGTASFAGGLGCTGNFEVTGTVMTEKAFAESQGGIAPRSCESSDCDLSWQWE